MRPIVLLALFLSVAVAFNIFRDEVVPDEQFLSARTARDASDSNSSDSDEKDSKITEGSGSGAVDEDTTEKLRRVVRAIEEGSGEGSGLEVTSAPVRFVRSVDVEGSGSGAEKTDE
ncbi:unnamed protein product [Caenorhabditis sp. 36 PRJEB53466]|nr:unnamed protein product [Caenorhabditis sp. 36 PRJEB53466]